MARSAEFGVGPHRPVIEALSRDPDKMGHEGMRLSPLAA